VFPGGADAMGDDQGRVMRDCWLLPDDATTEDLAYHLHSDIGDGLLHAMDCRSGRQIGSSHQLDHRDVVELVTTS
jgi:hypothetical protein